MTAFSKVEWQRAKRLRFKKENGFSDRADYGTGKLRRAVLERDGYRCVQCGMSDDEHRHSWARPITIDHKDKNRKHNTLDNLQTLCLSCHSRKDLIPELRQPHVPQFKSEIINRRQSNESYQSIADSLGFSSAAIWKWVKRWEREAA